MILGNEAAAEDAVQDTFCALAKVVGRNRDAATVPYAIRALRNQCLTLLRKRARHPESTGPFLEACVPDASEEERLIVREAIQRLPIEQREVVYLKVLDGMTLQEIAQICDVSINTVASRYRYAVTALRRTLRPSEETR